MKSNVFPPAIASALLLWAAFYPLNLGPLAFIALVPFLSIVRAQGVGRWRRYTAAWLGGWLFFVLAINWVRVAHPMMMYFAWPFISFYCSLYFPAALFLLRRLDRLNLPFVFTLPVVWVALEYVRAHFPTGFPFLAYIGGHLPVGFGWYDLGYTQHGFAPLLQAADLGGVYLVSAVVAVANGAAYEWAMRSKAFRWFVNVPRTWQLPVFTRELRLTAWGLLFAVVVTGYGTYRMIHPPFALGPRVALLQGNLEQGDKMTRGMLDREYLPLARRAATPEDGIVPDLIVWPETCWPREWITIVPGAKDDPEAPNTPVRVIEAQRRLLADVSSIASTNCLLGLNGAEWNGSRYGKGNTALLVRPGFGGIGEYAGRYDKIHLVPFGEYIPLRTTAPWLSAFTPYTHDYSCTPGTVLTRFTFTAAPRFRAGKEVTGNGLVPKGTPVAKEYRFGVLICYEDSDPQFARNYNQWGHGGDPVDFLVNISNDGWFNGTEEHEQHLAIARFRAVEARRSLVRAVNMGISAIIDSDGKIVEKPDFEWSESKKKVAVVKGTVPIDNRASPYAFAGDWVPAVAWGLLAVLHFAAKRKRSAE